MSEDTVERIPEVRRLEMSLPDIAHELNAEGVPTATGRGRCIRQVSRVRSRGFVGDLREGLR